jgi:tetratricopeptide (TPR) repeat protein
MLLAMRLKSVFWIIAFFATIFFGVECGFAANDSPSSIAGVAELSESSKQEFKQAEVQFDFGVRYLKAKRYEKAVESFESAIQLLKGNKLSSKAFNNLGTAYYYLQKNEKSLEAYQGAIHLDPECATANFNLGRLMSNLKKYEESIEAYQKFLKVSPGHIKTADAYLEMGKAADLMKDGRSSIIFTREAKQTFLESGDHKNVAKAKDKLLEFYEKYEYNSEDFAFSPLSPTEKIFSPIISFFQFLISFVVFI